jgi:rare lipoprotein A
MHLASGGIGFCLIVAASIGGSMIATPAAAFEINEDSRVQQLAMMPPLRPPADIFIDRSGRRQQGQATYYAQKFGGRKMANGEPLQLDSNVAASKSLPLGTVARVTNIKNGRSVVVEIQDRGPFREGGVVDLTPSVARQLGLKRAGIAPVIVSPISIPQNDGSLKLGAGAATHYRKFDAAEATRLKRTSWH